jgi:hypothetical protein
MTWPCVGRRSSLQVLPGNNSNFADAPWLRRLDIETKLAKRMQERDTTVALRDNFQARPDHVPVICKRRPLLRQGSARLLLAIPCFSGRLQRSQRVLFKFIVSQEPRSTSLLCPAAGAWVVVTVRVSVVADHSRTPTGDWSVSNWVADFRLVEPSRAERTKTI